MEKKTSGLDFTDTKKIDEGRIPYNKANYKLWIIWRTSRVIALDIFLILICITNEHSEQENNMSG